MKSLFAIINKYVRNLKNGAYMNCSDIYDKNVTTIWNNAYLFT